MSGSALNSGASNPTILEADRPDENDNFMPGDYFHNTDDDRIWMLCKDGTARQISSETALERFTKWIDDDDTGSVTLGIPTDDIFLKDVTIWTDGAFDADDALQIGVDADNNGIVDFTPLDYSGERSTKPGGGLIIGDDARYVSSGSAIRAYRNGGGFDGSHSNQALVIVEFYRVPTKPS
jgi:hypothetical protein